MSKRSNTVPYTNAARAGRTKPGLIEIIEKDDPRHFAHRELIVPNRADRRARGHRLPIAGGTRRNPVARSVRRFLARIGVTA